MARPQSAGWVARGTSYRKDSPLKRKKIARPNMTRDDVELAAQNLSPRLVCHLMAPQCDTEDCGQVERDVLGRGRAMRVPQGGVSRQSHRPGKPLIYQGSLADRHSTIRGHSVERKL